jgi:hypothetical protein
MVNPVSLGYKLLITSCLRTRARREVYRNLHRALFKSIKLYIPPRVAKSHLYSAVLHCGYYRYYICSKRAGTRDALRAYLGGACA